MTQETIVASAENWMVVTVTVATDDGTEAGTCRVTDARPLEEAIRVARDEAFERYGEYVSENMLPAYRVVAHIDTFPAPKIQETRVIAAYFKALKIQETRVIAAYFKALKIQETRVIAVLAEQPPAGEIVAQVRLEAC